MHLEVIERREGVVDLKIARSYLGQEATTYPVLHTTQLFCGVL